MHFCGYKVAKPMDSLSAIGLRPYRPCPDSKFTCDISVLASISGF